MGEDLSWVSKNLWISGGSWPRDAQNRTPKAHSSRPGVNSSQIGGELTWEWNWGGRGWRARRKEVAAFLRRNGLPSGGMESLVQWGGGTGPLRRWSRRRRPGRGRAPFWEACWSLSRWHRRRVGRLLVSGSSWGPKKNMLYAIILRLDVSLH